MSSLKLSSGMSVSFAPWNLGTTSCICGFGQFLFPFSWEMHSAWAFVGSD